MEETRFDLGRLHLAVDAKRERDGLSWSALASEVGVAPSTIRRMAAAEDAEADGVLALIRWLAAVPEQFVNGGAVSGRRLPVSGDGFVRVDMELIAEADGDVGGARGRTRTSIQRLVAVAQRTGTPLAALTRVSDV